MKTRSPQTIAVGHFVSRYLFLTGSWIHTQLVNLRAYHAIVLTSELENLDEFPFEPVYCYSQPFRGPGLWRVAARKFYEEVSHGRHRYFVQVIREENIRLLHAHFGTEGYYQLSVRHRTDLPLITTFYGADMSKLPTSQPKWRQRYQRLFDTGTLFLAEGPYMAQAIVDLGCPADKVKVQHLGVDLQNIPFIRRQCPENEPVRLLMTGSFREKKGISYGVRAFAQAAKKTPNMRLRIIGGAKTATEQQLMDECRQIAQKEGVGDRIEFLGYLPYSEYLREYERAHLFLAPSIRANDGDTEGGAPVSIIEASAAGMPIISTTHCDIPNVVIDGVTGLLAPERDVERLSQAILDLANARESWVTIGKAGRRHVEEEFDVNKQMQRLTLIYHSLLGR